MTVAALWESQDPRSDRWMAYDRQQCAALEAAYRNPARPDVELDLGGHKFTVSVKNMTQSNNRGGSRPVKRTDPSKVPICKYFQAGTCKNGLRCQYPHISSSSSSTTTTSTSPSGTTTTTTTTITSSYNTSYSSSSTGGKPPAAPDSDSDDDDALLKKFKGPPKEQTNIIHATPCRYFLAGDCRQGMKCGYPHVTQEEANQAPGLLYALVPCRWHKKQGGCFNGAVCPFKHEGPGGGAAASTPAPAPTPPPPAPTPPQQSLLPADIPCKYWAEGKCHHGTACIYNHSGPGGATFDAPGSAGAAAIPCKYWGLGKCNKGSNCPYKHEGPAGGGGKLNTASTSSASSSSSGSFTPHDPTGTGRCRSLFIGINYPKTDAQLSGCVNDVKTMIKVLGEFHGFNLDDKRILVDDKSFPGRYGQPNKKNILEALDWLVDGAKSGDTLFIHYSGHGCRVPDQDGDEDDGQDEALCPSDYKRSYVIIDDIIFDKVCKNLPTGVRLTGVMDCCHSGSMMDLEWAYTTSLAKRGNQLEKKFSKVSKKHSKADIILFSGCKDQQTSADVSNTSGFSHGAVNPGAAGGAATNAIAEILWGSGHKPDDYRITYIDLLEKMREVLRKRRFTQIPQLSSSKPCDLDRLFSITGPIAETK